MGDTRQRRLAATVGGLAVVAGLTLTGAPASASPTPGGTPVPPGSARSGEHAPAGGLRTEVIVRASAGSGLAGVAAAVRRSGGTVRRTLGLISGLVADVPADAVPALRALPGVAEVTPDGTVRMTADTWIDDGGVDAPIDVVKKTAGGKKGTVPLTGAGVGVALIDSGVAPVAGLDRPGKVVNGPDLSFESQTPGLADIDTYGHGTHMAGIIAGSDPGGSGFQGVAPGATLISLKVAASDGAADVSQVIAAIDWVVAHRNDRGLDIRVLNLSFGTDSTQAETLDPLSFAVEAAWRKGIVVVVAVGNGGSAASRVAMPAANPYVIAVGATDSNGTETRSDDRVASFSSRGNATRHADLIAAGRSIVSLRDPGSYVDTAYPGARIADQAGRPRFFRGSGTSQATAVVSGAAALLLQQRPGLSPDDVKALLTRSADPVPGADPIATGAGELDIAAAAALPMPTRDTQTFPAATGLGTLEGARGTSHVVDAATGQLLTGERDIFGAAWQPAVWAPRARNGQAWKGGAWNGQTWTGNGFGGNSWAATTWQNAAWSGTDWTGRSWTGSGWTGRSWTAAGWSGRSWTAGTWLGRSWTGQGWI